MVLNFFLDGQTLLKSKGFPEIVEKSANFLQINVDGIPKGFSTTAYFELSWEVGSVYNKAMVDGKCVVDEYITSLPSNTSDYIDYVVSFSVAGTNSEGVRFTTNKVDLIIKDTVYTDNTENTPEIPQSQYQQFVKDIANYSANPPQIGDNGNWFTWDGVSYVDTGVPASFVESAPAPSFKPYTNTSDILTDASLVGDGELYVLWVGEDKTLFDYGTSITMLGSCELVRFTVVNGAITGMVRLGFTNTGVTELREQMGELSPKKVVFEDGATITVENNTCYSAEAPISTLSVIYPQTDFMCSFIFTIADEGNVTISLPQSKYVGGTPSFANGETWEVNIKDGVVVGGLVE